MQHLDRLQPQRSDAVEDPLARPEQDRGDVERELVDDPGGERLADRGGAARDVDAAYGQALDTADGNGVDVAGGASTVRQALNAGVIDELTLDIAPVLLGSGERMLDGVETFDFEPVEVLHSPLTTHIRYRRRRVG